MPIASQEIARKLPSSETDPAPIEANGETPVDLEGNKIRASKLPQPVIRICFLGVWVSPCSVHSVVCRALWRRHTSYDDCKENTKSLTNKTTVKQNKHNGTENGQHLFQRNTNRSNRKSSIPPLLLDWFGNWFHMQLTEVMMQKRNSRNVVFSCPAKRYVD